MEEKNIATSKDLLHDAGISRSLGLWASTARFQLLAIRSNRSIILGLGLLGSLHPSCVNCNKHSANIIICSYMDSCQLFSIIGCYSTRLENASL